MRVRQGETALPPEARRTTPWWLWPHLCSLDAPLVAVAWQRWWAHAARVNLPWRQDVILAAAVWMIYLADRAADVAGRPRADHGTARHVFYGATRRVVVRVVFGLILALTVITPWWLSGQEFRAGLALLALAGSYFVMTHLRAARTWTTLLPKEAAVGGLFALGSAVFVLCRAGHISPTLPPAIFLGATLFFLNCALITSWEECIGDLGDPASLLNAFPGVVRRLRTGCLALAGAALGLSLAARSDVFLPVAAGAGLLWWLDHRRSALSLDTLRVLVDAALLTPWGLLVLYRSLG